VAVHSDLRCETELRTKTVSSVKEYMDSTVFDKTKVWGGSWEAELRYFGFGVRL